MDIHSRRVFVSRLLAGAGATVALNALPAFAAAHEHAATQVKSGAAKFSFFSPHEGREMEAICERIIPSDDGPGAREAGAVYFIDYVLAKAEPELQPVFRKGLSQLAADSSPKAFAELRVDEQIAILKKHEKSDEFQAFRTYTILGFLGDPKYGGNRDQIGWSFISFENPGMFQPPFGYYDAELLSGKKEGE